MAAGGLTPTLQETEGPPSPQEGPGPPATEDFAYQVEDLVLPGVEWPSIRNGLLRSPAGQGPSPFDRLLQRSWRDRLERGLFRYPLRELRTRVLAGPVGFVAQLNVERGLERRAPQKIQSVRQSFDPQQFNFTKIRPEEVLFCLARGCRPGAPSRRVLVAINVSPLEFGHVLLLPDPALALPQILTPEALRFGLEAVLLSAHPGFRVGFNSLGAFASVNHLHLHGYYLNWELLVESAPCKPLLPESGLFLLQDDFPAPGFLFYSKEGRQVERLAGQVARVTDYLVKKEVAHNLFVTRGAAPKGPVHARARPGIRVVVWPRRACFGAKDKSAFNVALCELAGHLPIKTAQDFEGLTEASAIQTVQKHLLSGAEFAQLQTELVALLREQ
ncbi:GDP-D-glucose phosphorylase 1 [Sceloporus undulatus]|uniref:GDP-D-glucose phosphorylase 1 n=1 Tax=Sceloporus undulatus TaxID=8520 RepID=UPI001C4D60F7|nr:GDP-D-glucose phosphorylase 1 [Sceloporus undulatus]